LAAVVHFMEDQRKLQSNKKHFKAEVKITQLKINHYKSTVYILTDKMNLSLVIDLHLIYPITIVPL